MPKEPPVERFRITCEVEPANLGPTVAQLTKLGLSNIHFELVEDVRTFAKRTNHEVSSEALLLEWIKDHPTFKAIEACKHFEANGRTKGSTYPALGVLVEKKVLKKLDQGNYARADVKHLAAPKTKPKGRVINEVSHRDFILRTARRNHGRFSAAKIKELFEKEGRNRDSVSTAIDALLKRKLVKRVGDGEYVLLQKTTQPPPVKSNGNGATVEEAQHG